MDDLSKITLELTDDFKDIVENTMRIQNELQEMANNNTTEEDPMTEDDNIHIIETLYEYFDDYINDNVSKLYEPTFYSHMFSFIGKELTEHFQDSGITLWENEEEKQLFIKEVFDSFTPSKDIPLRCDLYESDTHIIETLDNEDIQDRIQYLSSIEQPEQRTNEWYRFRHDMISASSLWKVFGTPSQVNSLIFEKCKPFEETNNKFKFVNTNSPLHWGQKYEPITTMIYEHMFDTKIGEFGCIQHPTYEFIGASPDGINIDPSSPKYGRMLEIKNIVNREITGIPKQEYWIQTQIQMECCELPCCDFMETRIKEFNSELDFYDSNQYQYKGVLLQFIDETLQDSSPSYVYYPLNSSLEKDSIQEWISEQQDTMRKQQKVLLNSIYWYLDEFSCVLIQRNREWFQAVVPEIEEVWNTIAKERVDGFEHRAAKKRTPSLVVDTNTEDTTKKLDAISCEQSVQVHKLDTQIC